MHTRKGLVDVVAVSLSSEQTSIELSVSVEGKVHADETESCGCRTRGRNIVALELGLVVARDGAYSPSLVVDHAVRDREGRRNET